MKQFFFPVILSIFFLYSGCEKKNIIDGEAPKPDFSTPEKTILSYWDYIFWADSFVVSESDLNDGQFFIERIRKDNDATVSDRRKHLSIYQYRKKIAKTVIDKDTAAVYILEKDQTGVEKIKYKYVLIKEPEGWKINAYLEVCFDCNGTGIEHICYNNSSVPKDVVCLHCKGKGWVKRGLVDKTNYGTYNY